uniref:Alkylated DNA repair protein AlkB homologue 8 N-terminal domain-containing protein n=1 Tax=Knipowitschia caucasica TaxID=637954 RepID=A0AAV2JIR7_KNICA
MHVVWTQGASFSVKEEDCVDATGLEVPDRALTWLNSVFCSGEGSTLCFPGSAGESRVFHQRANGSQIHDSVKLIKFADDTTLIGLISNNDESAYRREVDRLVSWCSGNNLELNAQKTVEMIVDFRKSTVPPPPPSVMDSPITSVESFRFLGTTITQDLKWEPAISSLIKKAQQRMYFLRQLRKAKLPAQMLVQFYTAIIESILTSSITVWFAGATVRDKQRLQRIVRSAEEVIGRSLPSLQDLDSAHILSAFSMWFRPVGAGSHLTVSRLRALLYRGGKSVTETGACYVWEVHVSCRGYERMWQWLV